MYSRTIMARLMAGASLLAGFSGELHAQTAQTIDKFLVIQPIQVCDNGGANCATVTDYQAVTTKIYQQANILPVFLPVKQINNTSLLSVSGINAINMPGNGQSSSANIVNAWFTSTLTSAPNTILYGEARVRGNGVVINSTAVSQFNNNTGRIDTFAHELGHNLGLGHSDFGAGGANNLVTAGSGRTIPGSIGDITPDGAGLSLLTQLQIDRIRTSPLVQAAPKITIDTRGSTPFDRNDFFRVSYDEGPSDIGLASLSVDLSPAGAFFDTGNASPGNSGSPFGFSNFVGLSPGDITMLGGTDGSSKVTLQFAKGSFTLHDSFAFSSDIDLFSAIDAFGATPQQLIGIKFDFVFEVGYAVQSELDADLVTDSTAVTQVLDMVVPPDVSFGPQLAPGDLPPLGTLDPADPEPVAIPLNICATGSGDDTCLLTAALLPAANDGLEGSDTLQLGGPGDFTFDVNTIGAGGLYLNFERFEKVDGSTVALTGTARTRADWTVKGGALGVTGGDAIDDAATVTVEAGRFVVADSETIGALAGGGIVDLGSSTLTTGGGQASTFSGQIVGAGNLVKTGASTFSVTNGLAHTGETKVAGGTLELAGPVAGTLSVDPGARLAGTGPVTIAGSIAVNGSAQFTGSVGRDVAVGTGGVLGGAVSAGGSVINAGRITGMGDVGGSVLVLQDATYTGEGKVSGTFDNSGTARLDGAVGGNLLNRAGATMSGNFSVTGAVINDGSLLPGNSPGIQAFGAYTGSGTLQMEVALDKGAAPVNGTTHDFVSIAGDAGGASKIRIVATGIPIATGTRGFELVRVGGQSDAGTFSLSEPVFSGGFQYLLNFAPRYDGARNAYFLRSVLREEIATNAALLAMGHSVTQNCRTQDGMSAADEAGLVWASAVAGRERYSSGEGSYRNDFECYSSGVALPVGTGVAVGIQGTYADINGGLRLAQGTVRLDARQYLIEGTARYAAGPFFARGSLGYARTEWSVNKALGGNAKPTIDGMIGSVEAGYTVAHDAPEALAVTLKARVDYDGSKCGDGCLLAGTDEHVEPWTLSLLARAEGPLVGTSIRPFVRFGYVTGLGGAQRVSLGNAVARYDARHSMLDVKGGLSAEVASHLQLTLEGGVAYGARNDVRRYEARGSLRYTW